MGAEKASPEPAEPVAMEVRSFQGFLLPTAQGLRVKYKILYAC